MWVQMRCVFNWVTVKLGTGEGGIIYIYTGQGFSHNTVALLGGEDKPELWF